MVRIRTAMLVRLAVFVLPAIMAGCETSCNPRLSRMSPIHRAAFTGDMEKVRALLKENPDLVNATDEDGDTPIILATFAGHLDVVKVLIARGAEVNAKGFLGRSALSSAAEEGYTAIAGLLLKNGANARIRNKDRETPLHSVGNKDIAKLLLDHGADPNAKDYLGDSPLHSPILDGPTAELLVAHGADVHARETSDNGGRGATPLHSAARFGKLDVVKVLLSKGADVNTVGGDEQRAPLHFAARLGYIEIVELLLVKGADVSPKRVNGWTPLHEALYKGQVATAELLINSGADVNAKGYEEGDAPLHLAAWRGMAGTVKLLLEKGADPNATEKDGWTPLRWAIIFQDKKSADIIRKYGGKE